MRDHATDRLLERAPQIDPALLKSLRERLSRLYGVNLPDKPSHVALHDPAGILRGYAVIKRVGKGMKPVVATVLGPEMTPPGERFFMDKAAQEQEQQYTSGDYLNVGGRTLGGGLLGTLGGAGLGAGAGALLSMLSRGKLSLNSALLRGGVGGGVGGLVYGTGKGYQSGRRSVARKYHPLLYPFIEKFI